MNAGAPAPNMRCKNTVFLHRILGAGVSAFTLGVLPPFFSTPTVNNVVHKSQRLFIALPPLYTNTFDVGIVVLSFVSVTDQRTYYKHKRVVSHFSFFYSHRIVFKTCTTEGPGGPGDSSPSGVHG